MQYRGVMGGHCPPLAPNFWRVGGNKVPLPQYLALFRGNSPQMHVPWLIPKFCSKPASFWGLKRFKSPWPPLDTHKKKIKSVINCWREVYLPQFLLGLYGVDFMFHGTFCCTRGILVTLLITDTDRRADATNFIISPASRSIIIDH